MANFNAGFILCLILTTFTAVPSLATDYTVGDSSGWALGVDYPTWTAGKALNVGDNLGLMNKSRGKLNPGTKIFVEPREMKFDLEKIAVFKYTSGHTVDEVSSTDYNACSSANAISSDSTGSTTIPLKTEGTHYFICGSMGHCASGMKLAVTVASGSGSGGTATSPSTGNGGSTASPETPTTGSPATPTVTPATPGTTSTHPSSSGSLSPITALFFTFGAAMAKLVLT